MPIFFRSMTPPAGWICPSAFTRPRAARSLFNYFKYETIGFNKFKLVLVGAFHNMIMDGIPRAFSKLKVAFLEVSAQWVPYVITDLAKRYHLQGRELNKKDTPARQSFFCRLRNQRRPTVYYGVMPATTIWSSGRTTAMLIARPSFWRCGECSSDKRLSRDDRGKDRRRQCQGAVRLVGERELMKSIDQDLPWRIWIV